MTNWENGYANRGEKRCTFSLGLKLQSTFPNAEDDAAVTATVNYPPLIGGTMASSSPVLTTVEASASTAT